MLGQRVEVRFGNREVVGVVVDTMAAADREGVREILSVLDEPPVMPEHLIVLARWIAMRYCAPLGEVLKAMLPAGIRGSRPGGRKRGPRTQSRPLAEAGASGEAESPLPLTDAQSTALSGLLAAVAGGEHRRILLHGVTGSGKTEVYLQAIAAAIAAGRQAIVMVPEIALTPQTIRRFAARFPQRVTVMHSALTPSERAAQWRRIRSGEVDVVVGSRSAVFAPCERLGIIVVDEEDASAYKQDRIPRYHAVDVALELGRLRNVPVVLGSATPRVDTFFAAHTGGLEIVTLSERISGRPLPPIEVVDLREELAAGNRSPLSQSLERALAECHDAGGQSLLFLNRRGSATVVVCRACGTVMTCEHCSVSLVYHQSRHSCDCHYCGATRPLPKTCSSCGSAAIRGLGTGTERLEAEIRDKFPDLRLLRMDRDTTTTRDSYFEIYESFRRGEADCLIGTQMVAKGWDLANIRLVGIVNADTALHFPDYRSAEVTFSLLTQVAGRAGRGDQPARVILQTYSPDHYAVRHAQTHDYLNFARDEIRQRKLFGFPPYSRMLVCTFSHTEDEAAEATVTTWVEKLSDTLGADSGAEILGPTPAFIHRLRGVFRWEFTIRGIDIEQAFPHLPQGRNWSIDVDPAG